VGRNTGALIAHLCSGFTLMLNPPSIEELTLTLAETPVPFTVRLAGVNVIAPANGLAPRNSILTVVPSSVFSRSFPSGPPAIRNAVLVGAPFKVMMTAAVDAPVEWLKATKLRDGRFCFLCPRCGEMLVYVNPRNNLAHNFPLQREPQQYRSAADDGVRLPLRRQTARTFVGSIRTPTHETPIRRPQITHARSS